MTMCLAQGAISDQSDWSANRGQTRALFREHLERTYKEFVKYQTALFQFYFRKLRTKKTVKVQDTVML